MEETELQQRIAEAEQRGYRRGLNEQIASKMQEPAMWEGKTPDPAPTPHEFQILASPRKSIWEVGN